MAINVPTGAGNVTSAGSQSALSLTLNKPANVADGDLLVYVGTYRNTGGTVTGPSGWVQAKADNAVNGTTAVLYKTVPSAAAETASTYAFSSSSTGRAVGTLFRVTGVNLSSPLDVTTGSGSVNTGVTSTVIPAITAAANSLVLAVAEFNTTAATTPVATPPAAMTTIFSDFSGTDASVARTGLFVAAKTVNTAGDTGAQTVSYAPNASNSFGFLLSFTPAVQLQTVVPASDITTAGFAITGAASAFAALDELVSDDSDYVTSPSNPTNAVLEVKLATLAAPADNNNHKIHVRARSQNASTASMTVALVQGTTIIASFTQALTATFTTYEFALTAGQAAAITDRTDLRVRVTQTAAP